VEAGREDALLAAAALEAAFVVAGRADALLAAAALEDASLVVAGQADALLAAAAWEHASPLEARPAAGRAAVPAAALQPGFCLSVPAEHPEFEVVVEPSAVLPVKRGWHLTGQFCPELQRPMASEVVRVRALHSVRAVFLPGSVVRAPPTSKAELLDRQPPVAAAAKLIEERVVQARLALVVAGPGWVVPPGRPAAVVPNWSVRQLRREDLGSATPFERRTAARTGRSRSPRRRLGLAPVVEGYAQARAGLQVAQFAVRLAS
jgi:hypothetical protein